MPNEIFTTMCLRMRVCMHSKLMQHDIFVTQICVRANESGAALSRHCGQSNLNICAHCELFIAAVQPRRSIRSPSIG